MVRLPGVDNLDVPMPDKGGYISAYVGRWILWEWRKLAAEMGYLPWQLAQLVFLRYMVELERIPAALLEEAIEKKKVKKERHVLQDAIMKTKADKERRMKLRAARRASMAKGKD